jgi:hypothetical protein
MMLVRGLVVVTVSLALGVSTAASATPVDTPSALRLEAGSASVTLDRWLLPGGRVVLPRLDLGVRVVAARAPFLMHVSRRSYHDPIVASQVVREAGGETRRPLPAGLVQDFSGLPDFFHVSVADAAGVEVVDRTETFCPNTLAIRVRPDSEPSSPYPLTCSTNPFTLGGVWAIQTGWGASTVAETSARVDLPDGEYTGRVSVNEPFRSLFGIDDQPILVHLTARTIVQTAQQPQGPAGEHAAGHHPVHPTTAVGTFAANPLTMPRGVLPDLRPLPAWRIEVTSHDGADRLAFAATVWNAGPGPLVVDGARRTEASIMDAHQRFYDASGAEVGSLQTGTMEWDPRTGHEHWHFTDFAAYQLLDEHRLIAVRSHKEAFCLANTDAVNYLVPNANWKPLTSDLQSDCGDASSQSLRQALEVGSGDTYRQSLPGQSFDLTGVPNGTYYIQVVVNPDRNLHETRTWNNVSLREVVLGGAPGARTVTVPPVGLVDS